VATFIEINTFAKDPTAVRALAKKLLTVSRPDMTDWETDFMQDMARREETLTTLQAEKLLEIRDDVQWVGTVATFSVRILLEKCWIARDDLADADVEFLQRLMSRDPTSAIKRRAAPRFVAVCKRLGLIEGYVDLS
jgi:hypothetical protein